MSHALLRVTTLALLVGACSLLPASPLSAQDDDVRADELSAEAHRIAHDMNQWAQAARKHEESGLLRLKGDTRAYLSFAQAARLYYHAGELRNSEKMFEAAGERALEVGDVYNAAVAFFNAAAVAQENGRDRDAQKLGWKAQKLTRSQLLNDEQRKDLTSRYKVLDSGRM